MVLVELVLLFMAPEAVEGELVLSGVMERLQQGATAGQELHRLFQAHKFNMRPAVEVVPITLVPVQPQEDWAALVALVALVTVATAYLEAQLQELLTQDREAAAEVQTLMVAEQAVQVSLSFDTHLFMQLQPPQQVHLTHILLAPGAFINL